ncbi:MAG: DUF6034 family protein [Burkholderiales bacterium]
MKKFSLFLIAAIAALLVSACQPTPEKAAVVGKDLEQMIKAATSGQNTAGDLKTRLGVPERYESYIEDATGKLKVTVDADIVLPQADSIPVVCVESRPFDQQTVDKLIELLFEDGKLYDPYPLSEMTKTEISDMLMKLAARKVELEGQGLKPSLPDARDPEAAIAPDEPQQSAENVSMSASGNSLDMVNEAIYSLKELAKTAPDEKKLVEVSGKFAALNPAEGLTGDERKQYEGKLIEHARAGQLCPQGGMRSIVAANNEVTNIYTIEYINRGDFDADFGLYFSEHEWEDMRNEFASPVEHEELKRMDLKITPEEAQQTAERFLAQMGIDYLTCECNEPVVGGSFSYYGDEVRTGNLLKAYRLQYVRQVSGVPVTYTNIETAAASEEGFIWNWAYEAMTLIINDSGIVGMKWEAPYRLKETVTESAAMLPFDNIKNVFEKMIIVGNSYYKEYDGEININEVRLGLARITAQNDLKSGLLIPVWDFFGTVTTHYQEGGQSKQHTVSDTGLSLLTINAIDGTVIDRSLGY